MRVKSLLGSIYNQSASSGAVFFLSKNKFKIALVAAAIFTFGYTYGYNAVKPIPSPTFFDTFTSLPSVISSTIGIVGMLFGGYAWKSKAIAESLINQPRKDNEAFLETWQKSKTHLESLINQLREGNKADAESLINQLLKNNEAFLEIWQKSKADAESIINQLRKDNEALNEWLRIQESRYNTLQHSFDQLKVKHL